MAQILCITNQKGGVGKTTTAVNLAAALAVRSKKTLLVDCDPQGNATTGIGINKEDLDKTLYHCMIGESGPEEVIVASAIKKLKVIPSRVDLIGFEVEMASDSSKETILKRLLERVTGGFDYIIIDCPPSLSLLTLNAMAAADSILIPLQCEFYALEGLGQLLRTIKKIKQGLNPELNIFGILLTMFDKRTNLSYQVTEEAEKYFKHLLFKTKIPRNVRLSEAPSFGMPIVVYDKASAGALSYMKLAGEIMNTARSSVKQ